MDEGREDECGGGSKKNEGNVAKSASVHIYTTVLVSAPFSRLLIEVVFSFFFH